MDLNVSEKRGTLFGGLDYSTLGGIRDVLLFFEKPKQILRCVYGPPSQNRERCDFYRAHTPKQCTPYALNLQP